MDPTRKISASARGRPSLSSTTPIRPCEHAWGEEVVQKRNGDEHCESEVGSGRGTRYLVVVRLVVVIVADCVAAFDRDGAGLVAVSP